MDSGAAHILGIVVAVAVVEVRADGIAHTNWEVKVQVLDTHQEGHTVGYWADSQTGLVDHTVEELARHSQGKAEALEVHTVQVVLAEVDNDLGRPEDKNPEEVVRAAVLRRLAAVGEWEHPAVRYWGMVDTVRLVEDIQPEAQLKQNVTS